MIERGPSTISTGPAWKTGRGLARPNGPIASRPLHEVVRDGLQAERPVDAQPRPQLIGLEHLVGVGVDARPELRHARRFHRQARGLLVAAEADEQVGAVLERAEHVEVRDAAAGSVRDVAVDRQHDGGLVIRVDELRGRDADDAAMPAVAADDEHVVRADGRIGLDRLLRLRDELGFLLLAAEVLVVELLRERRALRRPSLRRWRAAAASRCPACSCGRRR